MNGSSYHEAMQRGTPDFQAELYHIDSTHPRYQMQMHWHREFELIRVLSGNMTLYLNENEYEFSGGDAVLIPGGIVHGAAAFGCVYECIVFSPSLIYVSRQCRAVVKSCVTQSVFYKNNETVDSVFTALSDRGNGFEFRFLSGIYSLLAEIAADRRGGGAHLPKNGKFEKIKSALTLIEENYSTQFTLSELAESCGMSPNYFCRFFKQMTQKTPFDYINTYRINIACEMLSEHIGVTETAYSCGFNDLSYFIKIFRRIKGMSPKEYVRSLHS